MKVIINEEEFSESERSCHAEQRVMVDVAVIEIEQEWEYPLLVTDGKLILLAIGNHLIGDNTSFSGVAIEAGEWRKFGRTYCFDKKNFRPFKGSITLSND